MLGELEFTLPKTWVYRESVYKVRSKEHKNRTGITDQLDKQIAEPWERGSEG